MNRLKSMMIGLLIMVVTDCGATTGQNIILKARYNDSATTVNVKNDFGSAVYYEFSCRGGNQITNIRSGSLQPGQVVEIDVRCPEPKEPNLTFSGPDHFRCLFQNSAGDLVGHCSFGNITQDPTEVWHITKP